MTPPASPVLGNGAAFQAIFFEEADEHLAAVEAALLRLDPEAPSEEDLNAIFRAVHSIKGSAGMFGYAEIVSLTHVTENLLDILRKKERPLTRQDIDALLRAGDVVKLQVAFRRGAAPQAPDMSDVEAEVRAQLALGDQGPRRFAVKLGPLTEPVEDAALQMMLGGLAEMGKLDTPEINNAAGGEIRFSLLLSGAEADLKSVLALVVSAEQIQIEKAAAAAAPAEAAPAAEPAVAAPAPEAAAAPAAKDDAGFDAFMSADTWRERRKKKDRRAKDRRETDRRDTDKRESAQREIERQPHAAAQSDASSIRVSIEKIDRLVNLVGELVITEAMLAQRHGVNTDLARHTRNLQEAVMGIRMLPIQAVFSRFPRLVRELAQRLSKDVEIKLSGESTELDRGMIEKITDPLTHLVRNAIDHGLEGPEARLAAGKSRTGTVSLTAGQRGGSIVIEVRDDGRGLDRARILARAAQRGVAISPDAPDREVWQLIFEPGFSTAERVTDVSGRGVGMDVVRRNIQILGGKVDLYSKEGVGTTVTVSVPLTLAIMEGMTVAANGETYVLPLASVIESRRVERDEIRGIAGQGRTLRVREDYLPVHQLGKTESIAVIIEADGSRAALLVDELIGQQQVVVKSLEANFRKVPGISAATIMGDGSVALILDMAHIVNRQGDSAWQPS
jgi:two-component system chemotaxis sensor kinase CheA